MVSFDVVRSKNDEHFRDRPLVAVFIGATSGIGEYAVRELVNQYSSQQKTPLRIYVVGRNKAAADLVIEAGLRLCPQAVFHFVPAHNLALVQDVDKISSAILQLEQQEHKEEQPRIDLLMMTQGKVVFGGRQDTSEGLDSTMSLTYYSRIRFITNLLPLLLPSQMPAHVVSVYAGGLEGPLIIDDLSLRNANHYSFSNARSHVTHFTTMAFERLARENHGRLSLVHVFPGVVITPAYGDSNHPWWFKLTWGLVGWFVRYFKAIAPEEAGQRMLYLATERFDATGQAGDAANTAIGTTGVNGSGAYAVGENSEALAVDSKYTNLRTKHFEDTVWRHTLQAFDEIKAGNKFAD